MKRGHPTPAFMPSYLYPNPHQEYDTTRPRTQTRPYTTLTPTPAQTDYRSRRDSYDDRRVVLFAILGVVELLMELTETRGNY